MREVLFKVKYFKITFGIDVIHEEKTSVINAVFKEFSWWNGIMTSIEWTTEIIICRMLIRIIDFSVGNRHY